MGKIKSIDKGKRGELEVAKLLQSFGYEARRGQQYQGGPGSPDVVHNMKGFHIEVKFVEQFQVYKALEQAEEELNDIHHEIPIVFHRRKQKEWVVCMYADEFLMLMKKAQK